jgi:SnoaL-like domain
MITENLRTNQLSPEATEWYLNRYLDAMDALDIERYAAFLADDVTMSFNNAPAVEGKPAVVGMLEGYWHSFAAVEHEALNIYGTDRQFMLEALNHYVRHDGKRVSPMLSHLRTATSRVWLLRCGSSRTPLQSFKTDVFAYSEGTRKQTPNALWVNA